MRRERLERPQRGQVHEAGQASAGPRAPTLPRDTAPATGAVTRTDVFMLPAPETADPAVEEAIDWVYASLNERGHLTHGLPDQDRRTPAWTRAFLDALSAPDRDVPAVFITGSKGKGSTSVLTAAALMAGVPDRRPVGLVTSPHLVRFEERIRIDLRAVGSDELRRRIEAVRPLGDALRARLPLPHYASPVGTVTVLAALLFVARGARHAVYEAGRGGRFDDTAEVRHDVTVLTTLLPEHVRELGPTLEDIAWHKAGAIRAGTHTVVRGAFPPALAAIVDREAERVGAQVLVLGKDVSVRVVTRPGPPGEHAAAREPARVVVTTPRATYGPLPLPFPGRHQADNLAMALAAAEALVGQSLDPASLSALLGRVVWPGRLQALRDPAGGSALLDCSIEPGAVRAAFAHARSALPPPYVAVLGVGTGKDYRAVWEAAAGEGVDVVVTAAQNPFLRFPERGETEAWVARDRTHRGYAPDLGTAWRIARERAGPHGTVLVLGTVSLIADALRLCGASAADLIPVQPETAP